MNLFDIFKRKKLENLKTLLLLESISNMSQVIEEEKSKQLREKYNLVTIEKKKLEKIGLTQTQNYLEVKNLHKDLSKESHLFYPIKSTEFISYIKIVEEIFPGSFLVSYESFYKLIRKYNLWIDNISNYGGVVPEENLNTLYKVSEKLEKLYSKFGNWNNNYFFDFINPLTDKGIQCKNLFHSLGSYKRNKLRVGIVRNINYTSSSTIDQIKYFRSVVTNYFGIFPIPVNKNTIDVSYYDDYPEILDTSKAYKWDSIEVDLINNKTLLIACPKKYLANKGKIKISKKPVDPIVFQTTPYGVLIHSVWGEEAEDKVLADYMRVNNLIKEI